MDRIADDKISELRPLSLAHVPFPNITPRRLIFLKATIGLLLAGIFAWDLATPLGQVPWLLYAPVLLFTLLMPYRWDALVLAAACTALIVADFFFSPSRGEPVEPWIAIFNRSVGLVMIWVTALGCFLYKQAQQALAKVQDRLAYLVRNNPAVVYARKAGRDWVFSSISENARDVLGYDTSEFLRDPALWTNCIHPEDRAKISGDWATSLSSQAHQSFEYRFRHKDGAYRWLRDEVRLVRQPVEDGAPQPVYIGFCSDITERKRAEAALRNSESRLRAILDNSPNLIFVKDLQGRYVLVNREFEWAFSISHEQILGKTDAEIFPASQAAAFHANDRKVLEVGHALEFEEVALHKDGAHTSIVYKFPLYDHQGSPYAIGGIATDITERKRVAAALHAKETLLSAVFQVEPECVKLVDADGSLIMMNNAGLRMIEADSLEQVAGHCVYPLVATEHREQFKNLVERVFQGESGILKFEIVGLKGTRRWLETHTTPLRDEAGRITAAVGVTRDVTVHKQAEEALKESEERYRSAITALDAGILLKNAAGVIEACNQSAERILGRSLEELRKTGQKAWGAIHEDGSPFLPETFPTAITLRTGKPCKNVVMGIPRPDGALAWISINTQPLYRPQEITPYASVASFVDVTERKRAEDQLRQSRRQLQALTAHLQSVREQERARIARELHDEFGQVLTGLKIDLSWLSGVLSRPGRSKTVKAMLDRTQVMTRLVDESIATIRKLVAELRPAILDHLDLVAALEWQARDFQKRTGIGCEFRCALTGIDLDQDRKTAVFRIVQEALTNVARHAKATSVTISMEEAGGQLELVVEDDGRGITDHEMASPSAFGILGMQERVELLRGQLSIHGHPGVGTTVGVQFPTKTEE